MKISIIRYFLIFTAIIIGTLSLKYAAANLSYFKVDGYLTHWEETKLPTQEELDLAFEASDSMLKLHGHHPHYLDMAAKVYEWQSFKDQSDSVKSLKSLEKALLLYKKSSQLREHWPLTWAYMANVKSNMGILDDEFYTYINKAMLYGPYMPEVNLQISKIFLSHWGKLPGLPTKVGLEQVKRASYFHSTRYNLLFYARSIAKEHIVCTVGRLNNLKVIIDHWVCRENKPK